MRIGILADLHEDVANLRKALRYCKERGADQIVVLGDIFEIGKDLVETVALLSDAGAIGVFGNHDLGFCHQPSERLVGKYDATIRRFMSTLGPRLELDDCLFSHGLPQWDPTDPVIYYLGAKPEEEGVSDESFRAVAHRIVFVGHFHRWFMAEPNGQLSWKGEKPVHLQKDKRFLIVVGAVYDGWCAIYDTLNCVLEPIRL